jgi:hypothetical protein
MNAATQSLLPLQTLVRLGSRFLLFRRAGVGPGTPLPQTSTKPRFVQSKEVHKAHQHFQTARHFGSARASGSTGTILYRYSPANHARFRSTSPTRPRWQKMTQSVLDVWNIKHTEIHP